MVAGRNRSVVKVSLFQPACLASVEGDDSDPYPDGSEKLLSWERAIREFASRSLLQRFRTVSGSPNLCPKDFFFRCAKGN